MDEERILNPITSDECKEKLLRCVIVSDTRFLTYRVDAVYIHDISDLRKIHVVKWADVLPVDAELSPFGITTSHSSMDPSSCVGSFIIAQKDLNLITTSSVNA